jgi:hypothetical protein
MASIHISDLRPAGSELFLDSESFLNKLTDVELNFTYGGTSVILTVVGPSSPFYYLQCYI